MAASRACARNGSGLSGVWPSVGRSQVTPASPGRRPADWSCIWPRQLANSCSPSEGMEISVFHEHMRKTVRQVVTVSFAGAAALGLGPAAAGAGIAAAGSLPAPVPAVADFQYMTASTTPPAE